MAALIHASATGNNVQTAARYLEILISSSLILIIVNVGQELLFNVPLLQHLRSEQLVYCWRDQHTSLAVEQNRDYLWLTINNVIQSIMLRRQPKKLTLPHQTVILLPLVYFNPEHVIELGLGGGNIARFYHQLNGRGKFTSVESNPIVIDVFQRYFNPEQLEFSIVQRLDSLKFDRTNATSCWIINDIYCEQHNTQRQLFKQISSRVAALERQDLFSINLSNYQPKDIKYWHQLLKQRQHASLYYFKIPGYQNVVIHSLPSDSRNHHPNILPVRLYKRWQQFWRYHTNLC